MGRYKPRHHFFGHCIQPTPENPPAREHQGMDFIVVDDRKLQIAIKRRGRRRLPAAVVLRRRMRV